MMIETFMFLMLALCFAAFMAKRLNISSPILFVAMGLALAFAPGFDRFPIPPDMILPLFLPPLLMEAAYFTSWRDFKGNLGPILQLAIGFVIVTCVGIACAAKAIIPGMEWAPAFVLGAIVSPPDAVAATSIAKHVRLPRRVQTVLEGESLVNDATGLILYKFAVMAVVVSSFSLTHAALNFVWVAAAGIALGVAIGWAYMRIFPWIKENSVEMLSTFLIPYAAYFLAEEIGASGVLAVVATGLTVGWYAPDKFSPSFRVSAEAVWTSATFVFNGLVFLLIGLYFPALTTRLAAYTPQELILWSIEITAAAILIRFIWVFAITHLTRILIPSLRKTDPTPPWQNVFIIAWTSMRGVMSLATALALPLTIAYGTDFPDRDLIIFLTFSVILLTLLIQGLSLPWVIRKIGVVYDWKSLHEDWLARKRSAESALQKLEELDHSETKNAAALERIVGYYRDRIYTLGDGPNTPLSTRQTPTAENHPLIQEEHRIWQRALEAERSTVVSLRHGFEISDSVMNDLLHDIDLMHSRFKA